MPSAQGVPPGRPCPILEPDDRPDVQTDGDDKPGGVTYPRVLSDGIVGFPERHGAKRSLQDALRFWKLGWRKIQPDKGSGKLNVFSAPQNSCYGRVLRVRRNPYRENIIRSTRSADRKSQYRLSFLIVSSNIEMAPRFSATVSHTHRTGNVGLRRTGQVLYRSA